MDNKKMTSLRIDDNLKKLAYNSILHRYNNDAKKKKPETFSELIRNLIMEEWQRNKEELLKELGNS